MEIIVQKRGAKISLINGMLLISHEDDEHKIPISKITSLHLSKGCLVSTDALILAMEEGIDVLFVTGRGKAIGRLWNSKFGSISTIRKNQFAFVQSEAAKTWVQEVLRKKLSNQQALLITLYRVDRSTDELIDESVAFLEKYKEKIAAWKDGTLGELSDKWRGWEGACGKKYFACINCHLPDIYRFEKRSQHPARDMFNALLNYAYGMLYGKIEGALIKAGIDPFIGIMHRNEYNKPVLSYDIIEVFRYWADFVVTNLCMQQVIFPDMFRVEGDEWLLSDPGKRILIQSLKDYLDELVDWECLSRSRETHLDLYCQKFATSLKNFEESLDNQVQ
ncbi:CRISPR-associated endonuclease Cas1 [Flavihumibacter profundi]|uniref:CRISPR-associated endonuclease Cas1 n=1 Tax=Flavihumibacter profundi TaxID=2716883 RepID=UPI001CC6EBE5|nr:CRISPR-associated endonuclease Cas1 [Flavihumibacter profundi]MBZ5857565.1 CRISPR-associated endonuclease Cas1 [Flavihumibacter profundi]